jgi:cytochrome c biogenesis protein CcmG/thiol:disulfide interchange protein DsbE
MASASTADSDEPRDRDAPVSHARSETRDFDHELSGAGSPFRPSVFRTRVIPAFAIAMVVGLLGLLGYALFAPEDARLSQPGRINSGGALVLEDRRPAPDFEVTTFEGDTLRLTDLRGKIVVLNFWASWCPPCQDETPLLEASQDNLGDDVVLVGIDIWDSENDAREFLERYGVTYSVGRNRDAVEVDYGVSGVPETFIIDADGRIVAKLPGEVTSLEQLRGMVAEAR